MVIALACVPACGGKQPATKTGDDTGPAPTSAGADDDRFKHGSKQGDGKGGGNKEAKGPKEGAGGFKHGSKSGGGAGGGGQKAGGPKTGHQPQHGSGKGDGTGGGD